MTIDDDKKETRKSREVEGGKWKLALARSQGSSGTKTYPTSISTWFAMRCICILVKSLDIVTCGHAGVCVSIYMYLPLLDRCVYATEY